MQNCPDVQIWRRDGLCSTIRVNPVYRGQEAKRVDDCPPSGLEVDPWHFLFIREAMSFALSLPRQSRCSLDHRP